MTEENANEKIEKLMKTALQKNLNENMTQKRGNRQHRNLRQKKEMEGARMLQDCVWIRKLWQRSWGKW